MISIKAKMNDVKMRTFSKRFGETSNQSLLRVGVQTAKEVAELTTPLGRSKKLITQNIITGARINVVDVVARRFNALAKRARPRFKMRNKWVALPSNQILRDAGEVDRFIEKNRNSKGRVKKLQPEKRAVCKTSDMNKTLVRRKKLAGIAKGSWIGAGKKLARRARGSNPPRIGKNFMAWTQKHADKGTAKLKTALLGKSHVLLISNAPHTKDKGIVPPRLANDAVKRGWRKTLNWYRREVKRRLA
tara:strand:+ start:6886 stop:7623 length:738 start_codon:yes stop_codon:yes gene_type:complete